ncbi:MAG TPA: hypothetical protein VK993_13470 [Chthoniobacterales bacterium]|nr:hypothetical protein [Chthoniobacterales bacterium]
MNLGTRLRAVTSPRYLAALCVVTVFCCSAFSGCSREEVPTEERSTVAATPKKPSPVFAESVAISATRGVNSLNTANQASIAVIDRAIRVSATGDDPQLTVGISGARGGSTAVYLDFDSPAASALELYYQVANVPFSADHVIATSTKQGRNQILLQVDDPRFSGWLRLDLGQIAGEYTIHSIVVLSDHPLSLVAPPRPQAELAASFEASVSSVWAARTPDVFDEFKPVKDVDIQTAPEGLALKANGADPSLLLPEFDARQPVIIKVVVISPTDTALQLFYKIEGQTDYSEPQSYSQPLKIGANTIYLEHNEPRTSAPLRLDPGMSPGNYLLNDIEVRAVKAGSP